MSDAPSHLTHFHIERYRPTTHIKDFYTHSYLYKIPQETLVSNLLSRSLLSDWYLTGISVAYILYTIYHM